MNTLTELHGGAEKRVNVRFLRIVLGAGLATVLLTVLFLLPGSLRPGGTGWLVFSYLVVPTAGALGGLIFDMLHPLRNRGGLGYVLSICIGAVAYAVLFTLSFLMGANGLN